MKCFQWNFHTAGHRSLCRQLLRRMVSSLRGCPKRPQQVAQAFSPLPPHSSYTSILTALSSRRVRRRPSSSMGKTLNRPQFTSNWLPRWLVYHHRSAKLSSGEVQVAQTGPRSRLVNFLSFRSSTFDRSLILLSSRTTRSTRIYRRYSVVHRNSEKRASQVSDTAQATTFYSATNSSLH